MRISPLDTVDRFAIRWLFVGGCNSGMRALFERDVIEILLGRDTLLLRAFNLVMFLSALYVMLLMFVLVKRHLSASS